MERSSLMVYAGKGSSHSWTWLADLFEKSGIYDVSFSDSRHFTEHLADEHRGVIVSGGDGFEMATAIGAHGFSHLKGFIHRGGLYIGICAGAYLPLPSSIEPFDKFNISNTKIQNIDADWRSHDSVSPRVAVRYGSCSVVHPVRGELKLEHGSNTFIAPLYGGPVFQEPSVDEVLVRYGGITRSTEMQIDESQAISMLVGRPAVIRSRHGQGKLLLFGPHLEHPNFPDANRLFLEIIGMEGEPAIADTERSQEPEGNRLVERAIGDLKVAILGLENRSFLVGNKLWDGSRFLELVRAIESRYHTLDDSLAFELTGTLIRVRAEILKAKPASLLFADEGPERLVEAARVVVDNHFSVLRNDR